MNRLFAALYISALFIGNIRAQGKLKTEPYQLLNSIDLTGDKISGQIIIAVIDDGFLLDHKELRDFWWKNENEIPNNGIDDDGNGFIDDVIGWDIVDGDNDVIPLEKNLVEYYHGTATASIIVQMIKQCYGHTTADRIRIMPIKAVSDNATRLTLENGYQGIRYAIANSANIICMAWNGGEIDSEVSSLIQDAKKKGILMLASAGNTSSKDILPPASLADVYGIGAVDSNYRKYYMSNYGSEVDLVGFGDGIRSAHAAAPNAFFNAVATSAAVAQVCGAVAVLKIHDHKASIDEIMESIINTAVPLDALNPRYMAQLGAGLPSIKDALDYLDHPENRNSYFNPFRAKGNITVDHNEIDLKFHPGIQRLILTPVFNKMPKSSCMVQVFSAENLILEKRLSDWITAVSAPGPEVKILFENCKKLDDFSIYYELIPIDSTTAHCKELQVLTDSTGFFSDGSGDSDYANNVSCKWLISTEVNKRVKISFEEINIHPSDEILLFYGNNTLQENLVAKFSGSTIPPTLITASNELTVWFITDATYTAGGWKIRYETTLEEPGIK